MKTPLLGISMGQHFPLKRDNKCKDLLQIAVCRTAIIRPELKAFTTTGWHPRVAGLYRFQ
jgi:hypothetical protein